MGSHGNSNLDRGIALKVEGRYEEAITEPSRVARPGSQFQ